MLPLSTADTGYGVFKTACDPYQTLRNTRAIKPMVTAVWKYSFFHSFFKVAVKLCFSMVQTLLRQLYSTIKAF
jgi:hypothetical protein